MAFVLDLRIKAHVRSRVRCDPSAIRLWATDRFRSTLRPFDELVNFDYLKFKQVGAITTRADSIRTVPRLEVLRSSPPDAQQTVGVSQSRRLRYFYAGPPR